MAAPPPGPPPLTRVLLAGDVHGRLGALFARVAAVAAKAGPFDALLCAGAFFPPRSKRDENSGVWWGGGEGDSGPGGVAAALAPPAAAAAAARADPSPAPSRHRDTRGGGCFSRLHRPG